MSQTSLAFTSASELAGLIRERKISPVEVVDELLNRIARLNPKLNAYLTVAEGEARRAARKAEKEARAGRRLPPLHGVPISIKDLVPTRGLRTTGGSLIYQDYVPQEDAAVVERVRRSGAIILGKTNTPEFGFSATTENRLGDHCRNPWNPGRTSGGSSGGAAAAVAAGLGPLAIGSDGGGSIRIPAGFCGVYGLKPTYGRVSAHGSFGGMPLFSHVGPLTRTVADAALLLQQIAGPDPRDPTSLRTRPPNFRVALQGELRGLRLAFSPDLGYAAVAPEMVAAVTTSLPVFAALGCEVEEATPALEDPFAIFGPIALADGSAALGHLLDDHAQELMPYVKSSLERGRQTTGEEYSRALRALERFRSQLANFFQRYDLLVTPTTAVPAFPVGQRPREIAGQKVNPLWGPFPFTVPFNLTGQPAATLPCGFSPDGLPISLQLVGRWGEEITVLRASAAFEQARPWAGHLPPLA